MAYISKEERARRHDLIKNTRRYQAGDMFTVAEIVNDTGIDRHRMKNILRSMVREGELELIPADPRYGAGVTGAYSPRYRRPNPSLLSTSWRVSEEAYDLIAKEKHLALLGDCGEGV